MEENLKIAMEKNDPRTDECLETVLCLFLDQKTVLEKEAGLLSGGQKQILSIARSYMNNNELLLIDEPSKGLAPIVVEKVMAFIENLKKETTIILVEQIFIVHKYEWRSFLFD